MLFCVQLHDGALSVTLPVIASVTVTEKVFSTVLSLGVFTADPVGPSTTTSPTDGDLLFEELV